GQPAGRQGGVEQVAGRPGGEPDQEEHVDVLLVDLTGRKALDVVTAMSHHQHMILRSRTNFEVAPGGTAADDATRAVAAMMRDAPVPGMSIAVVRHDRVLFAGAFGWADIAGRVSATPDTSYLWFSMSKIATATAAMQLADEGRLDLDAPLAEYVGYLHAPGETQPTTRQLLTHTAGLANPLPVRWVHAAADVGPGPALLLRRFAGGRRPFRLQRGGLARYTNIGYLAAAQVTAAGAGRPFEECVRTAVLEPAGMTATAFAYQPQAQAAIGYLR